MLRRCCCALALAASLAAGCGGADAPPGADEVAADPGPEHIHGLGVNPADESLVIATHTGLYSSPRGEHSAQRIGDSRQDTMGFTVVGPDRFLGSGHPDERDDLPPLLGLIRSTDGGRSWQPVSLLGEADFHVLRASGRTIYGYDATNGRLLASLDAGRTWSRRRPPAPVVDLALDPRDAKRVVASTEVGLHESRDGGRSWRAVADVGPGLLAWTDALVHIGAEGTVRRSAGPAKSLTTVGHVGGPPAAVAADEEGVYVALHDNSVRTSRDGGRRWSVRVRG